MYIVIAYVLRYALRRAIFNSMIHEWRRDGRTIHCSTTTNMTRINWISINSRYFAFTLFKAVKSEGSPHLYLTKIVTSYFVLYTAKLWNSESKYFLLYPFKITSNESNYSKFAELWGLGNIIRRTTYDRLKGEGKINWHSYNNLINVMTLIFGSHLIINIFGSHHTAEHIAV